MTFSREAQSSEPSAGSEAIQDFYLLSSVGGFVMVSEYRDDDDDALRPMIHRAAERGDTETATRLLNEDPGAIRTRNELDNEPLHEACWAKRPAMVRLLLKHGADVNAVGDMGRTPLHFAVWDSGPRAVEIVEMLVHAGADINARDERLQENALGFALREYKDELEPAIRLFRTIGAAEPVSRPNPQSP